MAEVYTAEKSENLIQNLDEARQVSRWMDRIQVAKRVQEEWAHSSGANRFIKEYQGKFEVYLFNSKGQISVPPINEVFAFVQSDIASTYNRDPYITVNAKAGSAQAAKIWEVWLNYEWRELQTKEEIELEIIDKDLVGMAWHKVGHVVESEGSGDSLKIKNETLYSLRVDWRDMFWNIGARRPPKDCEWMAQRIVRPLEDVKEKYPNAAKLEGSTHPDLEGDNFRDTIRNTIYKDDIKVAVLYEIWDKRTKSIYTVAEGLKDKYLTEPRPWPEYLDEFPFLPYWDFAVPGNPRPLSAIAPWEPQILERMKLLALALNHAKRWNRQLFVKQGAIDPQALDKFERGDDGAIIEVNGDFKENFKFTDFGQIPTDHYLLMDRLMAISNDVSGQPSIDRGGVTKTQTRTIGELQLIKAGAKSRTDRKIDRLETHLEDIARHLMAHMKANFDFEKVIKVTGETPENVIKQLGNLYDPNTGTLTFTPYDIEGEFDAEVRAGSTLPLDKETQLQVLETTLSSLVQVATQAPASPLVVEVISQMFDKYGMKSLQEAYKKELALAAEQAQAKAQETDVDKVKSMADAQKRTAQAEQIQTETQIMIREEKDRPFDRLLEHDEKMKPKGTP